MMDSTIYSGVGIKHDGDVLVELQKLIDFAKANGLKCVDLGGCSFEFWDRPTHVAVDQPLNDGPIPLMGQDEMPSPEALLFAATEDPDELERILRAAQKPETTP